MKINCKEREGKSHPERSVFLCEKKKGSVLGNSLHVRRVPWRQRHRSSSLHTHIYDAQQQPCFNRK